MLTRRKWLGLAAGAALPKRPPNVVLIISDDHGWGDYGFMGHPEIRTPHLDRLAREGLLFTRGYVPTSLCRPSLASIMTGLYPHRHRITGNDPPGDPRDAANRARMVQVFQRNSTLTGILGRKGYRSHQSGKWWEGQCTCCGFTECMTHGDVHRGGRHGDDGLKIGRETMQPVFDFIERSKGNPFFLWYAPFLPHTPHNPPERLLSKYHAPDRPIAIARYWAMVEWLDETVGQLLAALPENTLVAYVADNGWMQLPGRHTLFETRAKLSPYDAGVRTPIMLWWPGQIAPRRDDRTLASSIDLAPSILKACDVDHKLPGIPLTDRQRIERRRAVFGSIFVHTSLDVERPAANLKYRWMVRDRWKLIVPHEPNLNVPIWERQPGTVWSPGIELYDLATDPHEKNDRAAAEPKQLKKLRNELDQWWTPA